MTSTAPAIPRQGLGRRLLGSPVVDLLLGPHGVDRYLELIDPRLTLSDARARVVAVQRQTPRAVTLTLVPNRAFSGFTAGQYLTVGVEIDGVRRIRTYSPASSAADSRRLELTVTAHPGGLVSSHLLREMAPGRIVHLGAAQGGFTLPATVGDRLVLISGGSGITPVLSMLRTLLDTGYDGEILFVHYARSVSDWLYADELHALARTHRQLRVAYRVTRGSGAERLNGATLRDLAGGEITGASCAACGPPRLLDAVPDVWAAAGGNPDAVLTETFTPPRALISKENATGTLRFTGSGITAPVGAGTLLEQAEAAGLHPAFGCRMGICRTCTCRKLAGPVRNLITGEVSTGEDEDIQVCVSAPVGDVALEL